MGKTKKRELEKIALQVLKKALKKRKKAKKRRRHSSTESSSSSSDSDQSKSSSTSSKTDSKADGHTPPLSPLQSEYSSRSPSPSSQAAEEQEKCDKIFDALDDLPTEEGPLGPPINTEFRDYWERLALQGLTAERRKNLLDKFPLPENCSFLKPPKLNEELLGLLDPVPLERDNRIVRKQRQLAAAAACLSKPIETLIARGNQSDKELMDPLVDLGRLLLDTFNTETAIRRSLVLHHVAEDLRPPLNRTVAGDLLFGADLGEAIKRAKVLELAVSQLRGKKESRPPKNAQNPAPRRAAVPSKSRSSGGGRKQTRPQQRSAPGGKPQTNRYRSSGTRQSTRPPTYKQNSSKRR